MTARSTCSVRGRGGGGVEDPGGMRKDNVSSLKETGGRGTGDWEELEPRF